jgi:hypothetical protein
MYHPAHCGQGGLIIGGGPMVQALASRPGSKASDDNLGDDDPDLLSFGATECEIICRISSRLQKC